MNQKACLIFDLLHYTTVPYDITPIELDTCTDTKKWEQVIIRHEDINSAKDRD